MVLVCGTSEERYISRTIPYDNFQPPKFQRQEYLQEAVRLTQEMLGELGAGPGEWVVYVCRGYILSHVRDALRSAGYAVEETVIAGKTQLFAEKEYNSILEDLGCSRHQQKMREWLAADEPNRRQFAKSGWKKYGEIVARTKSRLRDSSSSGGPKAES